MSWSLNFGPSFAQKNVDLNITNRKTKKPEMTQNKTIGLAVKK